jgi:PAS domain S-box-containing protein
MAHPRDFRFPSPGHRVSTILALAVVLSLGIFAADVALPAEYHAATAYVLVILLGLWARSPRYPFLAAAGTTLLLVGKMGFDRTPATVHSVYVNHLLATLVLWVTAALVARSRRLEEETAAQVTQLRDVKAALDQAAIVAATDVTGKITFVNDKFCQISKYSREELLGQDHRIVNSGLHSKEFMRDLWHTIARGVVWHGEIRNRAKDGTFYWVDTTIVPFFNRSGKPTQYVAIRHDITERKIVEERLRHQESLARVGQLAAMVAHEVKNPLAGIKGVLQVLMSRRSPADPEATVMHDVVDRIDALNELIQDLLTFSRPRPPKSQPIELRPLLNEAVALMRKDPIGEHVTIKIDGPDVALTGDSAMLKAVFSNLLFNAAQAMRGTGAIHIQLARSDDQCEVSVEDTGPGIPTEIRDTVFEPFFTTKSRGGGLGLAIARRSVELHGGRVTLACPVTGGTTMTVNLPLRPLVSAATA